MAMKQVKFVIVLITFVLINRSLFSQFTTTKLISPQQNQIDWSAAGVEGEIPYYTLIINVTELGAKGDSLTDNYALVQHIIDTAKAGTALYFPEGNFLFNSTLLLKDSVVLRGLSPQKTTLIFDLHKQDLPGIWIKSSVNNQPVEVTGGFEKGSKQVSVKDASQFKPGMYIEILQDNDSSFMYTRDFWNTQWAQENVGQLIEIKNIDGNNILLKNPLYYTFSSDLHVRARSANMIGGAGIENIKIIRADDGNDYNIRFYYAANCWIRNIEADHCDRGHVEILFSSHIEIRDSYFHHAYDYGEGGHGYGVNLADHPSDCLIENNIFHHLRHSFLAKEGSIGNVFAYNYSREPYGNPNDIAMHGHYGLMNLIEGNIVQKIIAGDWWGPSGPGNTYFRNRVEKEDIIMQDKTHSQNIIANEIMHGIIKISKNCNGIWRHSNINPNGSVDSLIFKGTIPASLYLKKKPKFFDDLIWPPVGPEFNLGENTIPAKKRWKDNIELVPPLD